MKKDLLEYALYPSLKHAILKIGKRQKISNSELRISTFPTFQTFLWGCLGHTAEKGMT